MKKFLILFCALALLLGGLAGCGGTNTAAGAEPAAEDTPSPSPEEPTAVPEETEPPLTAGETEQPEPPDFEAAYAKYAPETAVMDVSGVGIDWRTYFDALFQNVYSVYLYYGITDYGAAMGEDYTIGDWLREMAETQLEEMAMFYVKAGEQGLGLTAEDEAAIDAEIQSYADLYYNGDRDSMFEEPGASEEYYRFQAGAARLYDKLFTRYFGEDGGELSDADAVSYITDNGFLYAKHILFKTVDDAGDPLDDETVAAKKAAADEALASLRAADPSVLPTLFDALMHEHSEDGGLAAYPDGYFFQEGEMVTEFYDAAVALEEGGVSGIVESPYGYHILYRPVLTADTIYGTDSTGSPYTLRYYVASELFENMLDEWFDALEVTYAGDFETLSLAELFAE